MAPGGYHGKALKVDVGTGVVTSVPLPDDVLRRFVGGVGIGTYLLARESRAGIDALAPEQPFIVALSPLVGTPLTTSAKFAVVAKSPLTGRIGDSLSSDRFAIELKRCGIDALVIVGQSPSWRTVVIENGDVRIEDAADLLGLSAAAAETRLVTRLGPAFRTLAIGPAGERLVRFATVSADGRHAGRGGLGAVLGSKRIKAIAAHGETPTPIADAKAVLAMSKDLSRRSMGPATAKYREIGTVANVLAMNRLHALPTRNFSAGGFEGAEAVSGEAFHREAPGIRKYCAACTIGCEHVFSTQDGRGVRLEYEGLFALGPLCGVADRDAILRAAQLCDDLGIDVISAGGTVAFAMEAAKRGLLARSSDGESPPRFGDSESLLRTLRAIGARSAGLGDLLAEGSRIAAARIGHGAQDFAMHVKGLELPGYDPRAMQTLAVGYAVAARGSDHNKSGAYEADLSPATDRTRADDGKGTLAAHSEERAALLDSLVLCKFLRGVFDDLPAEAAAMLSAVTGWDVTKDELLQTSRRIVTAKKLYNVREGWTREEDTLPARIFDEPLVAADGSEVRLSREGLDGMVRSYYRARGWTEEGEVPGDVVKRLCLTDLCS